MPHWLAISSATLVAELKTWEKNLTAAQAELGRAFDRKERGQKKAAEVDELDLTKPEARTRVHAAICEHFDSIRFYRDESGKDFFVAWVDSARTDGFACFIDQTRNGPFEFWSPREHRLASTA